MDVMVMADDENSDFMANDAKQEASASTAFDPLFEFL